MSGAERRADAARAMQTLIDIQQRERGRFERDVPVETVAYEIDPDAVAAALAERLTAGRALVVRHPLVLEAAPARRG